MTKPPNLRREIAGIDVYRNDVRVRYVGKKPEKIKPVPRELIKEFTWESRKRLAFVASNTSVTFLMMATLTYPRQWESDGRKVKGHLNRFLNHIRRNGGGNYLWFLEFQKRGAPHFHILIENDYTNYQAVAKLWDKIVDSGDPNHIKAGTRYERLRREAGGRRYAVKYAMKMRQKVCPPRYVSVGRFWGHSRGVKPSPTLQTSLSSVRALGDIIGDHEKARDMYERQISIIYNASPDIDGL